MPLSLTSDLSLMRFEIPRDRLLQATFIISIWTVSTSWRFSDVVCLRFHNMLTLRHEQQKEDLEKNMTLRRSKKKESITRKMLEHERYETAALVDRQSSEMLELISARRSEYMQNESIFLDDDFDEGAVPLEYPMIAPIPAPPAVSKFQIYTDPIEFEDVDRIAISVS